MLFSFQAPIRSLAVPSRESEPRRGHGTRPLNHRTQDVFARTTTSMGAVGITPGSPIPNNLDPNITFGNDGGHNPFVFYAAPNVFHDAPEAPLHECSSYDSLPRGYARWTRSGLVFHDPQRCQRWSSDGTESFDLTDGSLDLEPNCSVDEEALV